MSKNVKLSNVVPAQIPAHIRQDYPTFEAFMKAYYEYLDQQQLTRNLEYLRDVDKTLDRFVSDLKDELAVLAPRLAKDRFFLKHAKEMYVSRGSPESYKFLFRLLYNKDVETVQLNEKVLKASGGNWQQDVSFFIKLESGKVADLENNFLRINSKTESGFLEKHERVYVLKVEKVEFVQDVYEVFIDRQYYGKVVAGDTISDRGVKALVIPTTTSVKITNPGSGFKIGQIFNINTGIGQGLQIKVTNIDRTTGALKALQVIAFGIGFEQPFDYNITKFMAATSSQTVLPNAAENLTTVNTVDVLSDSKDYGHITRQNFHEDYVEGDYVGEVLADFYARTIPSEVETTVATLRIELGAIAVYPGFYRNSQSLISDDSYIQDGYYYQDFSYLIRIDEKLTDYRDVVASTLHPVGRKMFGDYLIETSYDFTYEIFNPVIRLFFPFTPETVEAVDALDKVLSSFGTREFITDGVGRTYDYLDTITNHLVLNVRIGPPTAVTLTAAPILGPEHYTVDYANGVLTLDAPPEAGKKVTIVYATVNYNISPSWVDHSMIMHKNLEDSTIGSYDTPFKSLDKQLNPSTGYVDEAILVDPTRTNFTVKSLPTQEVLLDPSSTANQKDYFVMTDTGTQIGDDPTASTVIRDFSKRLAVLDAGTLTARPEDILSVTESTTADISKPLLDISTIGDAPVQLFSKILNPDTGYVDEVLPTDARNNAVSKLLDIDPVSTSDSATNAFGKALIDATGTSTDSATRDFAKALADIMNAPTDLISSRNIVKLFHPDYGNNDEIITAETTAVSMTKPLDPEIVLATDQAAVGFSFAPISDGNIALVDVIPFVDIGKELTENITLVETTLSFSINKYLDDSVEIADTAANTLTKAAFLDQVDSPTDEIYFTNGDGAQISEVGVIESSLYQMEKSLNESFSANTTTAWLQLNPYSSEAYFPNGYQSGGTTNL